MWQSVNSLFNKKNIVIDEIDIRGAVERFYREKVLVGEVRCEKARKGKVAVVSSDPLAMQESRMLEYDLKKYLKEQVDFELLELVVRR